MWEDYHRLIAGENRSFHQEGLFAPTQGARWKRWQDILAGVKNALNGRRIPEEQ